MMRRLARVLVCVSVLAVFADPGRVPAQTPAPAPEEFPVFRALERLASDPSRSKEERLSAIGGLGQAAHPNVTPVLLTLLSDRDPEIRSAAAAALGWAGNQTAVDPLLARVADAREPPVRTAAIAALGRIGDARAVTRVEALATDADPAIRREAGLALIEAPLSRHTDRVAFALRLLGDLAQDGYTRARAAAVLGAARDARAVEPLVRTLKDPRLPAGFAELPSPEGMTGTAETMTERLRSLHNVRARAARALGELQAQQAEPVLRDALSDSDPLVRIQSAAALGLLRARGSVGRLLQALEDPDVLVRQMAASALGAVGDPAAAPVLIRALEDPEAGLRERAALALGRLRQESAREALEKLAEEDDVPAVRQAAYWALGQLDLASGPQR